MRPPEEPPAFDAPWQAQAFAMTVHLHEKGVFPWTDWAQTLSAVLKAEQAPEEPTQGEYYRCWLLALEKMLIQTEVASAEEVHALTAAWHRAARATPHGQPILLENDPDHSLGAVS